MPWNMRMELGPDGSIGFLHRNKDTGKIVTRKFWPPTRQWSILVSCLKNRERRYRGRTRMLAAISRLRLT